MLEVAQRARFFIKTTSTAVHVKQVTAQLLLSRCFLVDEVRKLLGQVGGLKLLESSEVSKGWVALV